MDKDAVIATLRAHRAELERLGVIHAAVFGSVARGEAGPQSDIDIAIDMDYDVVGGLWEYAGLKREVAVIGAGTRAEIWDGDAWNDYLAEQEKTFSETDEEVLPGIF